MSPTRPGPLTAASAGTREDLAALARLYHRQGWMLGTSGNLSVRIASKGEPDRVVITASGKDKGALTPADFVETSLEGEVLGASADGRPSAETSIHLAIYRRLPDVRAVLHVHTVASTLVRSPAPPPGDLIFTELEMLKGWGLWEPGATAHLPIFANDPDVPSIAAAIDAWLAEPRAVPACLIEGHGLTAWGTSLTEAHRHVEITEFLCRLQRARAPA